LPRWALAAVLSLAAGGTAGQEKPVPSFAELEAAGAVIGEIRVVTDNIFDTNDPDENNVLYRAANAIHIRTRPGVIRRVLLFEPGQPVSRRIIEETERLIRQTTTVYEVSIRPTRYENGIVDLEVRTRDTWTLEPGLRFRREGGSNSSAINFKESNFLGTATTLGFEHNSDIDRTGSVVELSNDKLFDGWTRMAFQRGTFDDGTSGAYSITHPFYALDTRWAGGATLNTFDRRDALFEAGNAVGDYRHFQHAGDVFIGHSNGLQGRWTHRHTLGLNYTSDRYEVDPSKPPPAPPPADRTLSGPYFRYEAIEDDFLPVMNRDLIQRPEYLEMGLHSTVQIGRSLAAFGATEQPWQLSGELTKGFRAQGGYQLLTSAKYSADYGSSTGDTRSLGTTLRYFVPQSGQFLLYLAASLDTVKSPAAADDLLLGGDTGLRGYPIRYQRGTRRALFTAEERYYTNYYPFRLFRVGYAAYVDVGRAWSSQIPNSNPKWLADVGIGLRFLNARASFGNVLHLDLAFPVHSGDPSIRQVQLVAKTAKTF
jgi:outer membrane protein assembly factor BamA